MSSESTEATDGPKVFTPGMLAERWACSERHIRNMIDRGDLRAFKIGERLVRVRAQDVKAFEASHISSAEPERAAEQPPTRAKPLERARINALRQARRGK
ncbi:MAG: DNA-binding protein [Rhizobiaceae bacterium]|nr:MAG: DNA-binding protein [Rhizobiaceae bacterium]